MKYILTKKFTAAKIHNVHCETQKKNENKIAIKTPTKSQLKLKHKNYSFAYRIQQCIGKAQKTNEK